MCSASHRTRSNWTTCVVSCRATQRRKSSRSASSVAPGRVQVLADEQQPRRALGAEQGDVVLAEHPPGRVADRDPGLGPERRRRAPRRATGAQRPGSAELGGEPSLDRCAPPPPGWRARSRAQSRRSISSAAGRLGDGAEAGVVGGDVDRLGAGRADLGAPVAVRCAGRRPPRPGRCRRSPPRRCARPAPSRPSGAGLNRRSAAAARWTSSSVPSISSSRPATIVVARRRARGAPRSSVELAELDAGAGLAGDQLGGGDVDRARSAAAEHPVEAPGARRSRG